MKRPSLRPRAAMALLLASLFLAGCFSKAKPLPPPPTPAPEPAPPPPPPAPVGERDLKGAAVDIAKDLAQQIGQGSQTRTLVIDPLLERTTGQQTQTTERVERELTPALSAALAGVALVPFDAEGASKSRLVLTGTIAAADTPDRYAISVSLTDRQTGLVIAQSAARFLEAGLDATPTPFYRDSPALVRDRSVNGYISTSQTEAGKPADPLYVEQIPTAALLAAATAAFEAERWQDALNGYTAAAARPDGQVLRTFNGIYLANIRLGKVADAEQGFGKIAALGLATNNLAVKFFFRPNSTEFLADASLRSVYPMWLRQIARAAVASSSCLNIVGHSSHTGTEAVNDRISLQRAQAVRMMLPREVQAKSRATGVGFRKNIVGSGTDDARDAPDRRVEFEVISCADLK
jgi:outer membrane protein OmpA-like peptidoglycan-associated protein